MMTPGDFASLQEGREGLSTEDYIAWKLPEDEEEEYQFPLTLKPKKGSSVASSEVTTPVISNLSLSNGSSGISGVSGINGNGSTAV